MKFNKAPPAIVAGRFFSEGTNPFWRFILQFKILSISLKGG
jgi:hypothetical protein